MAEIYDRQRRQDEIQRSEEFRNVFSRIVSKKPNYKSPTTLELRPLTSKCSNCGAVLGETQKFCHECGTRSAISGNKK